VTLALWLVMVAANTTAIIAGIGPRYQQIAVENFA
jgi:hypothetical protein